MEWLWGFKNVYIYTKTLLEVKIVPTLMMTQGQSLRAIIPPFHWRPLPLRSCRSCRFVKNVRIAAEAAVPRQQILNILRCTLPVRSRYDVATLEALPLRWRCASVALEGCFHAASTTLTSRLERSVSVIKSRIHIIYMPRCYYAGATIPLRSCRLRCVVVALSLRS